jgi:hypothetical protein
VTLNPNFCIAATFAGASDTRLSPAKDSLGIPIFFVEPVVIVMNASEL